METQLRNFHHSVREHTWDLESSRIQPRNVVSWRLLWWPKEGSANDDVKSHLETPTLLSANCKWMLESTFATPNGGLLEMTRTQSVTSESSACNKVLTQDNRLAIRHPGPTGPSHERKVSRWWAPTSRKSDLDQAIRTHQRPWWSTSPVVFNEDIAYQS